MVADILAPVIAGGNAMVNHSWCYYHQKQCCIKTAVRHTAGTSCVPFSRRGVNLGLKDVATLYSLAWIDLRLLLQEPDVTQERPGFRLFLCFSMFVCCFVAGVSVSVSVKLTTYYPRLTNSLRNVAKADVSLFDRFLSGIYWFEVVEIEASHLGWACARRRQCAHEAQNKSNLL